MVDFAWFSDLAGKVIGKYTLDEYIGRGNIGCVYKAHETELESRVVAVKLIPGQLRTGWDNELRKVSLLSSISGVVHLIDHGVGKTSHKERTEVFAYTVWLYIPGRNLKDYIAEGADLQVSFLVALAERVLRVLHACKIRGVKRHGDLHSGNIIIGDPDPADIGDDLEPLHQIWVSDFGRGATGGRAPKDDYRGLAEIIDEVIQRVDWDSATASDRNLLIEVRDLSRRFLREPAESERRAPLELLEIIRETKREARGRGSSYRTSRSAYPASTRESDVEARIMSVGEFQVSEMLGENWQLWHDLFVPSVPARSRILEPDITTVVTGPRGCGKTMLFRRLSQRLMVECGPPEEGPGPQAFVGFYVNANDVADAFSLFPEKPSADECGKLVCYANLCVLSDFLCVLSAREAKLGEVVSDHLLGLIAKLMWGEGSEGVFLRGESLLERIRAELEDIKWKFPTRSSVDFPGYSDLTYQGWLNRFLVSARRECAWLGAKRIFLFIDDFTIPRITRSMQKVLNRFFFQRSSEFVCKVATESASSFVAEDSSGKVLQEGDDYQLVDMGEESLFLSEEERTQFLNEVLGRRLSADPRIVSSPKTLEGLLGRSGCSKTEFARLLRGRHSATPEQRPRRVTSQARGATRRKALYHGADVFASLWSGDTRLMIQLVQDLVEEATAGGIRSVETAILPDMQDKVLRNRGSLWLEAQARSLPTNPAIVDQEISRIRERERGFNLVGGNYGTHLKAIVEAFQVAARHLLLGPTYKIREKDRIREVPRMAFRIEVVDAFRLDGLAAEIYKDLIRYGLFMRDARGRSVRGFMVPRLYLRRMLLPYCLLALSKRDNLPLTCDAFCNLLLRPDQFATLWVQEHDGRRDRERGDSTRQLGLGFEPEEDVDLDYNDIETLSYDETGGSN